MNITFSIWKKNHGISNVSPELSVIKCSREQVCQRVNIQSAPDAHFRSSLRQLANKNLPSTEAPGMPSELAFIPSVITPPHVPMGISHHALKQGDSFLENPGSH